MQIIFSNRAYTAVIAETAEKIKTETGGVFLGCFENGSWYIIEAIDPGPKSVFQAAYFEYDQKYTEHLINKIARMYQAKLTLIGLWHRHPGSFDAFSSTDDGTNANYAKLNSNGAISLLVNIDPKFRITPYHVGLPLRYTKIPYKTGDDLIPQHLLQLKKPEQAFEYINGCAGKLYGKSAVKSNTDFLRLLEGIKSKFQRVLVLENDYSQEENETCKDFLIDSLLDDITYFSEIRGLVLKVEQNNGVLCLSHRGSNNIITKIHFLYLPRKKQIVFTYDDDCYLYTPKMFESLLLEHVTIDNTFKAKVLRSFGLGKDVKEESNDKKVDR